MDVFFRRLPYFLVGIFLGSILVFALFGWRDDLSFNYLPEARVKSNFTKKQIDTASFRPFFRSINFVESTDSLNLKQLIESSDVIFSESETSNKECNVYQLELTTKDLKYKIKNCKEIIYLIKN